jgi:Na+/H+ antiporter NhaA
MLQTSQRIGNAIGAAVISAVFYAAVIGAPAAGAARETEYGRAYAAALLVSVGFTVAAFVVALRAARRQPAPTAGRAPAGSPPAVALRPDQQ